MKAERVGWLLAMLALVAWVQVRTAPRRQVEEREKIPMSLRTVRNIDGVVSGGGAFNPNGTNVGIGDMVTQWGLGGGGLGVIMPDGAGAQVMRRLVTENDLPGDLLISASPSGGGSGIMNLQVNVQNEAGAPQDGVLVLIVAQSTAAALTAASVTITGTPPCRRLLAGVGATTERFILATSGNAGIPVSFTGTSGNDVNFWAYILTGGGLSPLPSSGNFILP